MSRYEKLKNYKGIKKDLKTGRYLVRKYINGREHSKSFDSLKEAVNWRANFHPSVSEAIVTQKVESNDLRDMLEKPLQRKLNGEDLGYYFRDVWELYQKIYIPSLERSSQEHRLSKQVFYLPLMNYKMVEITANLLDVFIAEHRKSAIENRSKRSNFDDDFKCLKALLNWYRQNYDPLFMNPVLPRHKHAGIIRKIIKKNKKMKPEQLISFFNELPLFWRDFAECQFYMGARVSEVAGLQVQSVDFKEMQICIQYVAVWAYRNKEFEYLKEYPKNGEISYASINKKMEEILKRRIPLSANGFIFHENGEPLRYRTIQYQFNKALKKAGLGDQFSSTHIMRHSMGTITRKVTGSVDMAQAVTRHKDIQIAQQYASLPTDANRKAVHDVNLYLEELENN